MTYNEKIELIKNDETYQEILAESFNGVMYDMSKKGTYNTEYIETIWNDMTPSEKDISGGIMKGVFNFIQE